MRWLRILRPAVDSPRCATSVPHTWPVCSTDESKYSGHFGNVYCLHLHGVQKNADGNLVTIQVQEVAIILDLCVPSCCMLWPNLPLQFHAVSHGVLLGGCYSSG